MTQKEIESYKTMMKFATHMANKINDETDYEMYLSVNRKGEDTLVLTSTWSNYRKSLVVSYENIKWMLKKVELEVIFSEETRKMFEKGE